MDVGSREWARCLCIGQCVLPRLWFTQQWHAAELEPIHFSQCALVSPSKIKLAAGPKAASMLLQPIS